MTPEPFITLEDITVRVGDRWILDHTHWRIHTGEHWVIWGANGAGKTTLARALTGEAAVVQGRIDRHYEKTDADGHQVVPAMVSPDQYHSLVQRANIVAEMRHFSGSLEGGARARELVATGETTSLENDSGPWHTLIRDLQIQDLPSKPLEALSSGEMTRLLIARALASRPRFLILDEPFNGLDPDGRQRLTSIMERLAAAGIQLVLITHRANEIADCFTHVIRLEAGRAIWQGSKAIFLEGFTRTEVVEDASEPSQGSWPERNTDLQGHEAEELVRMRQVRVRYGETLVLNNIDWVIRAGEHWALIGPNGAGKSTLLKLISGDNLQGYANELILFGRRKGTGESLWEVKQHIGWVDDTLQARYQRKLSGYDVVCSGFFDSVGLYRRCTPDQRRIARRWIDALGLQDLADTPFTQLSFGRQRMVLITRAMVKQPRLLILDEPCNGLDQEHRNRLLALLDRIGQRGGTSLLYVSHRPDEMPACISHRLFLQAGRVTEVN